MTDKDIETFTTAFLADDAETAMRPEFEELAIATAMTYAKSGGGMRNRPAKIKPGREQAVLDVLMANAYPGERLEMSLSRLAKAAGAAGFPFLSAFTACATYKIFPHLTEKPYGRTVKEPTFGDRRRERRGNAHAGPGGGAGRGETALRGGGRRR